MLHFYGRFLCGERCYHCPAQILRVQLCHFADVSMREKSILILNITTLVCKHSTELDNQL